MVGEAQSTCSGVHRQLRATPRRRAARKWTCGQSTSAHARQRRPAASLHALKRDARGPLQRAGTPSHLEQRAPSYLFWRVCPESSDRGAHELFRHHPPMMGFSFCPRFVNSVRLVTASFGAVGSTGSRARSSEWRMHHTALVASSESLTAPSVDDSVGIDDWESFAAAPDMRAAGRAGRASSARG